MTRFLLATLAAVCLTAAITSPVSATDTTSYGTLETCKFPFLHKGTWWNTCTSIGPEKPWCILKPQYKPPPPGDDWLTCADSLISDLTALVDGVQDDCVTREVSGSSVTGCSSDSETGPFTCVTKSGKIGTCLGADSKLKAGKQNANIKTTGLDTDSDDNNKNGGTSKTTIIVSTLSGLGAVGLVAGLFVYRRRQSRKTLDWQKSGDKGDPSDLEGPGLPAAAAATAAGNRDSTASSQMFSPVGPNERLYPVISTYTPTLGDELEIQPGDQISILIEYDDGWCQGINHSRGGQKGVFPKHCVDMTTEMSVDSSMPSPAGPPTPPLED